MSKRKIEHRVRDNAFGLSYHWSLDQVEFATDILFARQSDLWAIYDRLTGPAIHTVKPDNIAPFLGRKLNGNYQDEMGNRFNTRIEGTRIQHTHGAGVDQNVRQVPADPAHRDHRGECSAAGSSIAAAFSKDLRRS